MNIYSFVFLFFLCIFQSVFPMEQEPISPFYGIKKLLLWSYHKDAKESSQNNVEMISLQGNSFQPIFYCSDNLTEDIVQSVSAEMHVNGLRWIIESEQNDAHQWLLNSGFHQINKKPLHAMTLKLHNLSPNKNTLTRLEKGQNVPENNLINNFSRIFGKDFVSIFRKKSDELDKGAEPYPIGNAKIRTYVIVKHKKERIITVHVLSENNEISYEQECNGVHSALLSITKRESGLYDNALILVDDARCSAYEKFMFKTYGRYYIYELEAKPINDNADDSRPISDPEEDDSDGSGQHAWADLNIR